MVVVSAKELEVLEPLKHRSGESIQLVVVKTEPRQTGVYRTMSHRQTSVLDHSQPVVVQPQLSQVVETIERACPDEVEVVVRQVQSFQTDHVTHHGWTHVTDDVVTEGQASKTRQTSETLVCQVLHPVPVQRQPLQLFQVHERVIADLGEVVPRKSERLQTGKDVELAP